MRKILSAAIVALAAAPAAANICGTDYQNFNPTTGGLDFVTVHSSETLKPCIINMGIFANYAANSLAYSRSLGGQVVNGQRRNDRILSSDFSIGFGLTDRWDFGFNVPVVLQQTVEDDYFVSSFDGRGATEIKANTKYRFVGDEHGGLAGVVSLNKNLIQDNPFAGENPGLTWNFELAADTTIGGSWAVAVNAGYRKRNPGKAYLAMPFVPLEDQYIYSAAASYLVASLDTKVIAEIYGSRAAKGVDQDTDRNMNSLEGLIGLKHDVTQNMAVNVGYTRQIDASLGGPEWRVYAGLNWAIGPVCKTEEPVIAAVPPPAPPAEEAKPAEVKAAVTEPAPEVYKLDVDILFGSASDRMTEDVAKALEGFATKLKETGFKKLVIEGHTDSIGSDETNAVLSLRRANRVADFMIERQGLPKEKVEALGFGPTKPIGDNGNYQGRKKNRRVEMKVTR